jgi:hypothetical protein
MHNFWMILFAAQAVVALVAFLCENGKETRFEDEKLTFRS